MKNYIVFDLEWNQSSEGKNNSVEHFPFEIIEIGAVKLDEGFQMVSEFHKLITPQVYTRLHYKISEVTHMDIKELNRDGELFPQVIREFIEWCGEDYVFCTWGSMDLTELQRNMDYHQIENPFARPLIYYDVQKLYGLGSEESYTSNEKPSLDRAVEELELLDDRTFHRALDDAYYTGRVLQAMDPEFWKRYVSVDYYRLPEKSGDEIYLEFPTYSKFVSRTYETKEEALGDKAVTDLVCQRCHRMLRKKMQWFSLNQKQYFCLGVCPEHGYVRGKIRMKRSEQGLYYVVKTQKPVDQEGAEHIFQKKEEQREKRRVRSKAKKNKKRTGR